MRTITAALKKLAHNGLAGHGHFARFSHLFDAAPGGLCALLLSLAGAAMPLAAHHAFAAEFDAKKPIKIHGTVTKMEWINPHAWIHVDVMKPDGTVEEWMIEAGTPNTLLRRGFTRDSLKAGTEVVVDGYQSKDGSLRANGRDITLPNGQTLFLGNADSDAPK